MNANSNPGASAWAESADVIGCARALEGAAQNLCGATLTRSYLAPAEVDAVLAHFAAAAAALPQAARQLSDILDEVRQVRVLAMDTLSDTQDPDLDIDTARLHLDATREPAVSLYRHLGAAHQQTADSGRTERSRDNALETSQGAERRHPERREPPRMAEDGFGQGRPRQPR